MLGKGQYIEYQNCKRLSFLNRSGKEKVSLEDEEQDKIEQALKDKSYAYDLFKDGVAVNLGEGHGVAFLRTKNLMEQKHIIYRGAISWDDFNCIVDIMVPNGEAWDFYLVKLKNSISDEDYKNEVEFASTIAKMNGIDISSFNIIYLNSEYVREDELNIEELFLLEDVTELCRENILPNLEDFKGLLYGEIPEKEMIKGCLECEKMDECFGDIPKLSVFNLPHVKFEKKKELFENNIVTIEKLIETCVDNRCSIYKPSPKAREAIELYKLGGEYVDRDYIREFLSSLKYPLYFLDFETFMNAIPMYKGMKPYQQITFQYSLHILENEGGELIHKEFLGEEGTDPSKELALRLVSDIGDEGSVIVYHQQFEKGRIKELSEMFLEHSEKLLDISSRIVDLEKPFADLKVFRRSFNFRSSIKVILPALYPNDEELDYHSLNIQNGQMAMDVFPRLHLKSVEERKTLREDLLSYCRLDTLAMVKIYEYLKSCL